MEVIFFVNPSLIESICTPQLDKSKIMCSLLHTIYHNWITPAKTLNRLHLNDVMSAPSVSTSEGNSWVFSLKWCNPPPPPPLSKVWYYFRFFYRHFRFFIGSLVGGSNKRPKRVGGSSRNKKVPSFSWEMFKNRGGGVGGLRKSKNN